MLPRANGAIPVMFLSAREASSRRQISAGGGSGSTACADRHSTIAFEMLPAALVTGQRCRSSLRPRDRRFSLLE
jgi:hypothetical protein